MQDKQNINIETNFQNTELVLNLPILGRGNQLTSSSPFQHQNQNSFSHQIANILSLNTPKIINYSSTFKNSLNLRPNNDFFNKNNYFGEESIDENFENQEEKKIKTESSIFLSKKRVTINEKNFGKKKIKLIKKKKKKISKEEKFKKIKNLKKYFFINPLTFNYLKTIFFNQTINIELQDLENLNLESKSFLFFILHRKMNKQKNFKIENLDLRDNNLIKQKIDYFRNFCSGKRFLENLSFVFKAFINYQKKYLKLNNEKIYHYYFEKISIEKKIDLKIFFDPTNEINPNFKNFSENYLELIIKSDIFKKDFIYFLNFTLKEIYLNKVEKKFKSILKKLEEKLIEKKEKNESYKNIFYHYFIKNRQCKLPWCISELEEAIDEIINKIDN